ncbi:unnamed protein product [Closterium sp. Naga37s-1]|nr:unnamed protein product [Closterium sp. Naga37s-1]
MSFGQLSDPRLPSFLVTIIVARYHPLMFRSSPTLSPLRLFTSPSSASHPPPLPPIPLLCLRSPSSASHPPPLPPFPLLCLPSPSSASLPPPLPPFPLLCLPSLPATGGGDSDWHVGNHAVCEVGAEGAWRGVERCRGIQRYIEVIQVVLTGIGTLGIMLCASTWWDGMEGSSVLNVSVLLGRMDEVRPGAVRCGAPPHASCLPLTSISPPSHFPLHSLFNPPLCPSPSFPSHSPPPLSPSLLSPSLLSLPPSSLPEQPLMAACARYLIETLRSVSPSLLLLSPFSTHRPPLSHHSPRLARLSPSSRVLLSPPSGVLPSPPISFAREFPFTLSPPTITLSPLDLPHSPSPFPVPPSPIPSANRE